MWVIFTFLVNNQKSPFTDGYPANAAGKISPGTAEGHYNASLRVAIRLVKRRFLAKRYCQTFFGKPVLSISDFSLIDKPFS